MLGGEFYFPYLCVCVCVCVCEVVFSGAKGGNTRVSGADYVLFRVGRRAVAALS